MNIEEARDYALSLNGVTEELFGNDQWISFRIAGKWFMLIQLDAPEPRVAVKLTPERNQKLREHYEGIRPAYHMNKQHWSDVYLEAVEAGMVRALIRESFDLVFSKLPKKAREQLAGAL